MEVLVKRDKMVGNNTTEWRSWSRRTTLESGGPGLEGQHYRVEVLVYRNNTRIWRSWSKETRSQGGRRQSTLMMMGGR